MFEALVETIGQSFFSDLEELKKYNAKVGAQIAQQALPVIRAEISLSTLSIANNLQKHWKEQEKFGKASNSLTPELEAYINRVKQREAQVRKFPATFKVSMGENFFLIESSDPTTLTALQFGSSIMPILDLRALTARVLSTIGGSHGVRVTREDVLIK